LCMAKMNWTLGIDAVNPLIFPAFRFWRYRLEY
jgi:hypothetical protein